MLCDPFEHPMFLPRRLDVYGVRMLECTTYTALSRGNFDGHRPGPARPGDDPRRRLRADRARRARRPDDAPPGGPARGRPDGHVPALRRPRGPARRDDRRDRGEHPHRPGDRRLARGSRRHRARPQDDTDVPGGPRRGGRRPPRAGARRDLPRRGSLCRHGPGRLRATDLRPRGEPALRLRAGVRRVGGAPLAS